VLTASPDFAHVFRIAYSPNSCVYLLCAWVLLLWLNSKNTNVWNCHSIVESGKRRQDRSVAASTNQAAAPQLAELQQKYFSLSTTFSDAKI